MTVGVFDSGIGGLSALAAFHRTLPEVDCLYFADRGNAPYGRKTKEQLVTLVTNDIEKLRKAGADRVLIACCTASTVYGELSEEDRKIALPIITPTAKEAVKQTVNRKIGVICTDATANSDAFPQAILHEDRCAEVFTLPTQNFVALVESGVGDSSMTEGALSEIRKTLSPLLGSGIDTLILGCTHFSHIRGTVSSLFPNVRVVCSALCGAEAMAKSVGCRHAGKKREGSLTYLD